MAEITPSIEALLHEDRRFPPPEDFAAKANIRDPKVYEEAEADFEGFWARWAEELHWFKKWDKVLQWHPPFAQWFVGGKINVSYNCLDRHLNGPRRNKAALVWEGEPGDWKVYTYGDLHREVCRFANGLKSLGVKKGDRVTIYMPMIPELPIAMLACARIGAPHSVVFGGFSPEALRGRINDCETKVVVTADGGYRRGRVVPLKQNTDEALEGTSTVEKVIVVRRVGDKFEGSMKEGRDIWWDDLVAGQSGKCDAEPMDSEDMLYILYTSGTTGKPKGVVHTTAGYLLGAYATTKWVFDLKEDDVYWCTADIGWVTGHSYIVYGPLANGATSVMYEGAPDYPDRDRFWAIVEKYR
ncbi:MAG: AMP-binding protein, partial [Dehalococcoidia bacterium]